MGKVSEVVFDKKTDRFLKVAIAGAVVASNIASEYTSFPIKVSPEVLKVLDDGRKFSQYFHGSGKLKANALLLDDADGKDLGFYSVKSDADADSPFTKDYLKSRRKKKIAGSILSIGGVLSSSHTAHVNTVGAAKEGNALFTTHQHMSKLGAIRLAHLDSKKAQEWIDGILQMKEAKMAVRGIKFVGSVVPIPAGSIAASIGAECLKLGVELSTELMCDVLAKELHYSAFVDWNRGRNGPAIEVIRELFTKRGATRIFGSYDPNHYIREPAGWKAIGDKIAMI